MSNTRPVKDLDNLLRIVFDVLRYGPQGLGESGEITIAWVQFPRMRITPGQQTYTSLGHRTYQYKSSRFKTEIKLDQRGIVENYPPYWKMEA